ncbi:MAG: hypothetical protein IJD95_00435 [Clostridia bacterium]|nr:hypothetical protein [Clostridia bacterium]
MVAKSFSISSVFSDLLIFEPLDAEEFEEGVEEGTSLEPLFGTACVQAVKINSKAIMNGINFFIKNTSFIIWYFYYIIFFYRCQRLCAAILHKYLNDSE